MTKVSVVMSVYNEEKYLSESIESIINQTFDDFEFIICDDASTDNTIDIIYDYMKKDNRIKLVKNKKNVGLAESLNKCITISRGEYIARMDADDIALSNRLEKQVNYLDNNKNITIICSGVNLIDESSRIWGKRIGKIPLTTKNIFKYNPIAHPTVMMRKKALLEVGGYTVTPYTRRGQDFDLWCKFCNYGYEFAYIDEILLNYREYREVYSKRTFKKRIDFFRIRRYWRRRLQLPLYYEIFAFKQIVAGIIPQKIMHIYHNKKFSLK